MQCDVTNKDGGDTVRAWKQKYQGCQDGRIDVSKNRWVWEVDDS